MANGIILMKNASQLDKVDTTPRYLCQRCGNCCRWPGDVRVTEEEVSKIARFLGMRETDFVERCTRLNANRTGLSIIDKPNGECLFLEGVNECRIQPVKPGQCSGFPNDWNFPGWREQCEAIEVT
jgi:Fe-S-cluster containining protein